MIYMTLLVNYKKGIIYVAFLAGTPVSSTNKTDSNLNIVESSVKHHQTNKQTNNKNTTKT
jgi:hypothetical protein